jgi:hypothetical protein
MSPMTMGAATGDYKSLCVFIYIYIAWRTSLILPAGLCDKSSAVFGMKAVKFRILCSQLDVF